MSDVFNFQRVVISLILSLLLIITFCIPTSFIKAISSPLRGIGRIYPLSLGTDGNENAGIKGYEFEYAYLKTSEWTTLIGDLEDGNSMLRVDMINIPGTGLDLGFGITYNSFNSDINIGLGKGWTSDLHQSVYEDPLTHNVTYVTSTGAKAASAVSGALGIAIAVGAGIGALGFMIAFMSHMSQGELWIQGMDWPTVVQHWTDRENDCRDYCEYLRPDKES